tara:strand:- start:2266 stop:2568 length:303 start_codon:yes stop_codon:yes gene_type:complete
MKKIKYNDVGFKDSFIDRARDSDKKKRKVTREKTIATTTRGEEQAYVKTIYKKSGAVKRVTHVPVSIIGSMKRIEKVTKKGKVKKPRDSSGFFIPTKYNK